MFVFAFQLEKSSMALRHRTVSIGRIEDRLKEIVELFNVSDDKLFALKQLITTDCKTQLDQPPTDRKRMHDTYVVNLPDGTEHGEYIVLDFGGKFFRVVYVKLNIVLNKTGERRYSIGRLSLKIFNFFTKISIFHKKFYRTYV